MEILHLRYFVAVAEERNFTRAAARLQMAASPLSQRIKDLEREIGAPLFVRGHHRIDLTAAGEALLPLATGIVDQFDAVPRQVRDAIGTASRSAVVGIAPDVSGEVRDTLLERLGAEHPDVVVRLWPASTEPLLQALVAGRLDLALVHGPVTARGVRSVRMETRPVGVALAEGLGFDDRTSVRLEELAHLPFASIGHDAAPGIYQRLDDTLDRLGVHKRISLVGDNFAGLAHLVATGQAFTMVSLGSGSTAKVFAGEPVRILPIDGTKATITTVAAWREDRAGNDRTVADLATTAQTLTASPD